MELPPQRFSRPSQSTALPPILNFIIPPVFQTCGFVRWPHLAVLLTTRSHSTALTLVSLTRMQDRRNRLRLGLKTLAIIQCLERIVNLSVMLIIILANPDARVIIITGEAT